MAVDEKQSDPGAPVAKDAIDPDLVKLPRTKAKIGVVTAAGVMFLAAFFAVKLNADRRFAGNAESPQTVTVADITAGKVDKDKLVAVQGELVMAHAIRAAHDKKGLGLRVVPVRGSGEAVWVVLDGDGYAKPTIGPYEGRLRSLDDLPFAETVRGFIAANPRPLFATAAAARAGFSSGKVRMVSGEEVSPRDGDRVGFDVTDPNASIVVCTFNEHHADAKACTDALAKAGITATGAPRPGRDLAYFDVAAPPSTLTTKLEAAKLWGTRVDPVTRHYDTTWGKLKTSAPTGFTVDTTTLPDAQLDLIGMYVVRSVPENAYAVIIGESPKDYWYVMPVTVLLALIALIFAWALVRAVKRDLMPTRA
jgi:hypothetical protein